MTSSSSRREFLRWSAGFSVLGAGAPFALQLTAAGTAAAATASPGDYKAIVCLFLDGGQDSNNLVLATDGAPAPNPTPKASDKPPVGTGSWGRYATARGNGADPIALRPPGWGALKPKGASLVRPENWGGVAPIPTRTAHATPGYPDAPGGAARTFALHPMLAGLAPKVDPKTGLTAGDGTSMWEQGRLAVLANVGTLIAPFDTKEQFEKRLRPIPPGLASHNDQSSAWQAGGVDGAQSGWGGRLADLLASQNPSLPIFSAVSAGGNAVFLSGEPTLAAPRPATTQYQVNTDGDPGVVIRNLDQSLFGSASAGKALRQIITGTTSSSTIAKDYCDVVQRAIAASASVNGAFGKLPDPPSTGPLPAGVIAEPPTFFEPHDGFEDTNGWTGQLHTIAQMIAVGPALGYKRQVFFARLNVHDTHDHQNPRESFNLAMLAQALTYFDQVMTNIGMADKVTTFTAGDFSRGFATNGSGTDHAWGGHHLIMGGAVNGGDIYGKYPTLGINAPGFDNPDLSGNNFIPTSSVDQYGATMGRWFGLSNAQLAAVFPNLGNFATSDLGFMKL